MLHSVLRYNVTIMLVAIETLYCQCITLHYKRQVLAAHFTNTQQHCNVSCEKSELLEFSTEFLS